MKKKSGVSSLIDVTQRVLKALNALPQARVLVGIPEEKSERRETSAEITNAAAAYINNYGAPEMNIPARPFMEPGIRDAKPQITKYFQQAGKAILAGKEGTAFKAMEATGLAAASAVKRKITTGPFDPLSPRTIQGRANRGRRGAKKYLEMTAAGETPPADLVKPLINTGQMRNAITYVVEGLGRTDDAQP